MGSLIDIIGKKIKEMKDLRQREERRDNKTAQEAIDRRYKALSEQINQLMLALKYAKQDLKNLEIYNLSEKKNFKK